MKNQTRILFLIALFGIAFLLQNCGTDDPTPVKPEIFFAGTVNEDGASYSIPAYWNDGELVKIGDGSTPYDVNNITVDGTDIYLVGGNQNEAGYLKNGVLTTIPKDETTSWETAYQLIIKNGKKYMYTQGMNGLNFYRYFVDATPTTITGGRPSFMTVSDGGDVYFSGTSHTDKAVYWKNGTIHPLSDVTSHATSIQVVGNDVYVSGFYLDNELGWMPTYWKNGTQMPVGTEGGQAWSMLVVKKDVYLVGYSNGPVYWKNGVKKPLDAGEFTNADSFNITVKNGDVYVNGKDYTTYKSLIWKNGTLLTPFDGTQEGYFNYMLVK